MFKVVARESVTVPAGTFDAFKIEGRGYTDRGDSFQVTYWIAPEKVRSFVAYEEVRSGSGRGRKLKVTNRVELVSFREAG